MKLDSISHQIYIVARNEAKLQSHEYVTPEHFLYAAIMFDAGREILAGSGGHVGHITEDLHEFLNMNIPKTEQDDPVESVQFVQLFELAGNAAINAERQEISIGSLLVAIFGLSQSHAAFILKKNGVSRFAMLRYISHEMPDRTVEAAPAQKTPDSKDDKTLRLYAVNMNEKARSNEYDPLIGRETELRRAVLTLSRRIKHNPVLVGDPGVGKTSIVEGLAQLIVSGDVPDQLKNAVIYSIDMGNVIAGTKYRGDFEERFLKILNALENEPDAVCFIDEIHNVVGAGSISGGSLDATSILKPFLSKGKLRFIGSTTHEEYKKHFEKDAPLSRRFSRIDVTEPSVSECEAILLGLKDRYETHHGVTYDSEAITAAVALSGKFINDRKLPDKAIDVIDEAGALVALSEIQNNDYVVTKAHIEAIVAQTAKIPDASVTEDETDKLLKLADNIKLSLFGQDEAVEAVVSAIKASRSGLNETERPVANLLFVGPTGVGKTEIAKLLSSSLSIPLLRYDMSEYQEAHSVARLIGAPPGYVGYEEGGLLTEAVRKTPYAVLLLDEIEKAHQSIMNVLLQVMDYGVMTDNVGKKADFRNVILIMTSNAGAKNIGKPSIGFSGKITSTEAVTNEVERVFPPEFRNRLDEIIIFNHINYEMAEKITQKMVGALAGRIQDKNVEITVSADALSYISNRGLNTLFGAREIKRIVDRELKKELVDAVLFGKLKQGGRAEVVLENGRLCFTYS